MIPHRLSVTIFGDDGNDYRAQIVSEQGVVIGFGAGRTPADALLNACAQWAGLRVLPRLPLEPESEKGSLTHKPGR